MGALETVVIPSRAERALAQAAWDMFYQSALSVFDDPNLDLRQDRAMDKTIRTLGRRPRAPLTPKERDERILQDEVRYLIASACRVRNYGQRRQNRGDEDGQNRAAVSSEYESLLAARGATSAY